MTNNYILEGARILLCCWPYSGHSQKSESLECGQQMKHNCHAGCLLPIHYFSLERGIGWHTVCLYHCVLSPHISSGDVLIENELYPWYSSSQRFASAVFVWSQKMASRAAGNVAAGAADPKRFVRVLSQSLGGCAPQVKNGFNLILSWGLRLWWLCSISHGKYPTRRLSPTVESFRSMHERICTKLHVTSTDFLDETWKTLSISPIYFTTSMKYTFVDQHYGVAE